MNFNKKDLWLVAAFVGALTSSFQLAARPCASVSSASASSAPGAACGTASSEQLIKLFAQVYTSLKLARSDIDKLRARTCDPAMVASVGGDVHLQRTIAACD